MMMMAVDGDFKNRKTWLYNALSVLRAQLLCNINPDNSWPESIRYHNSALDRIAVFAKALKNCLGENWFADTKLKDMFGYTADLQTPLYQYLGGISTPAFGDHVLSNGSEFSVYAPYLSDIAQIDKPLADKLYFTWRRAGSPMPRLFSEQIALSRLFAEGGSYRPEPGAQLTLPESVSFPDAGTYLFRKGFPTPNEGLFAVMSSPRPVGHGHLDQGSFMIWKDRTPIVMESGVEGYFDGTVNWHLCSYSHACMLFSSGRKVQKRACSEINLSAGTYSLEHGWLDTPRVSEVLDYEPEGAVKSIRIRIENAEGAGTHIRQIFFAVEPEIYIVNDVVENFHGKILFNLPVVSKNSKITGAAVFSQGLLGVNLQTEFLGARPSIQVEQGRSAPMYPSVDGSCELEFIRAVTDAENGFTAVLYPMKDGDKSFVSRKAEDRWCINVQNTTLSLVYGKNKLINSVRVRSEHMAQPDDI